MFWKSTALITLSMLATITAANAEVLYSQGFESNTSGWYLYSGGDGNGGINQTPNSTPPGAASGNYYATVNNNTNSYMLGYGSGGYTLFGNTTAGPLPYPGAPFTESMDIYINPATAAPTIPGTAAFWLDATPSSTSPNDVLVNGGTGFGGEHDFAFFYNGTSVTVEADNGSEGTLADITSAGWYDFQFLYSQSDSTGTDLSDTTLSVLTLAGALVGTSATLVNNSDGDPLENQYLAGPGYDWITVWQDGFSNNQLDIDNIVAATVSPVPEPASMLLFGAGLVGFGMARRRRNKSA